MHPLLPSVEYCNAQVLDLGKQPVITKDTVQLDVDALAYFRIVDPRNAVYRIQVSGGLMLHAIARFLHRAFALWLRSSMSANRICRTQLSS